MKFGHFDDDAREYVITTPRTPLPWINYLGSEAFFSLVSHTAGGYSFYKDAKLRRIPIVMITSRTADKHRNYAMSLGVDVYLGKPYRDDELLGHVARLTGGPSSPDVRPAGRSLRPA